MATKKILYPVGTPVTLRKYPEIKDLIVTQYIRGEKYPYRVGFSSGDDIITTDGKSKFSVKGLKRTETASNSTDTHSEDKNAKNPKSTEEIKEKKANKSYTKEEVNNLLQELHDHFNDMLHVQQRLHEIALMELALHKQPVKPRCVKIIVT